MTMTSPLTINPFGELPVLQDGDLKHRDAQAILVYLALKYDTSNSWYPNDPNQRGLISQWLATECALGESRVSRVG